MTHPVTAWPFKDPGNHRMPDGCKPETMSLSSQAQATETDSDQLKQEKGIYLKNTSSSSSEELNKQALGKIARVTPGPGIQGLSLSG